MSHYYPDFHQPQSGSPPPSQPRPPPPGALPPQNPSAYQYHSGPGVPPPGAPTYGYYPNSYGHGGAENSLPSAGGGYGGYGSGGATGNSAGSFSMPQARPYAGGSSYQGVNGDGGRADSRPYYADPASHRPPPPPPTSQPNNNKISDLYSQIEQSLTDFDLDTSELTYNNKRNGIATVPNNLPTRSDSVGDDDSRIISMYGGSAFGHSPRPSGASHAPVDSTSTNPPRHRPSNSTSSFSANSHQKAAALYSSNLPSSPGTNTASMAGYFYNDSVGSPTSNRPLPRAPGMDGEGPTSPTSATNNNWQPPPLPPMPASPKSQSPGFFRSKSPGGKKSRPGTGDKNEREKPVRSGTASWDQDAGSSTSSSSWKNGISALRGGRASTSSSNAPDEEGTLVPKRQPTIMTTPPPVPPPLHHTYSTDSYQSMIAPTSPTYGLGRPSGNLHPSSSLTASNVLQRSPSFGSTPSPPVTTTNGYDGAMGALYGGPEFLNPALLSNIAVYVKDSVPKGIQIKGAVEYPRSFTGKDVVSTILVVLPLPFNFDRKLALTIARYLQDGLWFHEVDWSGRTLHDGVEDVFIFDEDEQTFHEGNGAGSSSKAQFAPVDDDLDLPTGVLTRLTKCYSPLCSRMTLEGQAVGGCYSATCPNRATMASLERAPSMVSISSAETSTPSGEGIESWASTIPPEFLESLDPVEVKRQELIFELISSEKDYLADFDLLETTFFDPLRKTVPPIIEPERIPVFFSGALLNVLEIREHSKAFLETLLVRQREQTPLISVIGDVIFAAAVEWQDSYVVYARNTPFGENVVKIEKSKNPAFAEFLAAFDRRKDTRRRDMEAFQNGPNRRLQKYSLIVDQLVKDTPDDSPDKELLIQAAQYVREQCTQANEAMAAGRQEAKRQLNIDEMIDSEQKYYADLSFIEKGFIEPLKAANPPIIAPNRMDNFLAACLSNIDSLREHSAIAADAFAQRQRDQAPMVRQIGDLILEMVHRFAEDFVTFAANTPFSDFTIKEEQRENPAFANLLSEFTRKPEANRLPLASFVTRPTFRVPRIPLLTKAILDHTADDDPDKPHLELAWEAAKNVAKRADAAVNEAKLKFAIQEYSRDIVYKAGDGVDLDLQNPDRKLFHRGRMMRKPDGALTTEWADLHVILFDHCLVITKARERDGRLKFTINRRPIPLELLQPVSFVEGASTRGREFHLRSIMGAGGSLPDRNPSDPLPSAAEPERSVYPISLRYLGRHGETFTLYVESASARTEWQNKMQEALAHKAKMMESTKVFDYNPLSHGTFGAVMTGDVERHGNPTCSVPFNLPDGRKLVAIGCADGLWIGLRNDPRYLKQVIHLPQVTHCAVLQEFGFLLVLADKILLAYPLEIVVPAGPQPTAPARTPQRLCGKQDVTFFRVGKAGQRTLVIYVKKNVKESVFKALEPVTNLDHARGGGHRFLNFGSSKPEYFRVYKEFFVPSESYSMQFLRSQLAILCTKGVEIMNVETLRTLSVPDFSHLRNDPRAGALQRRCEDSRALGMFRLAEDLFLVCYNEFAFWTDKHGDPLPNRYNDIIDWEGAPTAVAYQRPYVVAFDGSFIEVRDAYTGKLAQIIQGQDIRCTYDGTSVDADSVVHVRALPEEEQSERRVHFSMRTDRYHTVFELRLTPYAISQRRSS